MQLAKDVASHDEDGEEEEEVAEWCGLRFDDEYTDAKPVDFKPHHLVRAYLRSLRPSNCVNFWCNESFFA